MAEAFYTLVTRGTLAAGDWLPSYRRNGEPEFVSDDPRQLHPSKMLGLARLRPAEVILGPLAFHEPDSDGWPGCEIARLSPRGRFTRFTAYYGEERAPAKVLHCAGGWDVAEILPIDGLLGPNARHIIAAMQTAERVLVGLHQGRQYDAYYAALEGGWGTLIQSDDEDAAAAALCRHGADGNWYRDCATAQYGTEITALAARDLIDSTPEWTREAYLRATQPWRAAFGAIHPGDRTPVTQRILARLQALVRATRSGAIELVFAFGPYQ